MKTYKEIQLETLESMRENLISKAVENDVFLSALQRERFKSGNEESLELIKNIRDRETSVLQLEVDIKLVEEKINGLTKLKDKPKQPKTDKPSTV